MYSFEQDIQNCINLLISCSYL